MSGGSGGGGRRRSSSFLGAQQQQGDVITSAATTNNPSTTNLVEALEATQKLWELVYYSMEDPTSQQTVLHSSTNVCLIKAILDRAKQLDYYSRRQAMAEATKAAASASNNKAKTSATTTTTPQLHVLQSSNWLSTMLQMQDGESGYTPFHRAMLRADLPVLLLLIKYATSLRPPATSTSHSADDIEEDHYNLMSVLTTRMQHRPLSLLQGADSGPSNLLFQNDNIRSVFQAVDKEGFTPFQLLQRLQVRELEQCRKSLVYSPLQGGGMMNNPVVVGRPRRNSFEGIMLLGQQQEEEQNEFAELHQYMQQEQQHRQEEEDLLASFGFGGGCVRYGCEVLSFGRTNHLALGVQGGNKNNNYYYDQQQEISSSSTAATTTTGATTDASSITTSSFRPHRVSTFAQDRVDDGKGEGGSGTSAVAIAAAAHHTLVVTRNGNLFAFGVGTGGRLGTGDNERHCPAPTRVLGPLQQRKVVAIAAAENHSLCVTSDGAVYAFGSNRFGQLGYSSSNNNNNNNNGVNANAKTKNKNKNKKEPSATTSSSSSSSRCCLPRRVDDLWKKHVLCISVAAGEKHSVALSQKGEVYVWGCNASGQLGIHRKTSSNSGLAHKVQRVDALWNDDGNNNNRRRKLCFRVAASSQSTLVLAKPNTNAGGLPVNQVYAWGHGNHVPIRVQFNNNNNNDTATDSSQMRSNNNNSNNKTNVFLASSGRRTIVNPVGIACARHHNAAITADGRVYTWGFHADPLGGGGGGGSGSASSPSSNNNKANATASLSTKKACYSRPQLVTGMLPEEGGGFAVGVSASENHTAVITNEGSLYTWGASYGKGVMGHEGVRWQPNPKRVSGVCRAVAVAAAKEHTILLMGTSFPPSRIVSSTAAFAGGSRLPSLERLAAQEVIKHVDLFNVLPILMTAERTNSRYVIEYCNEFIRLNLDGVLNVGQKSIMDMYLKEQVASGLLLLDEDPRDRRERPLVLDVALAARELRTGVHESETILSDPVEWIQSCEKLFRKDSLNALLNRMRKNSTRARSLTIDEGNPKYYRRRSSSSVGSSSEAYRRGNNKKRSSSVASDAENDVKMSSSERCIMLTTNMDLSTRDLVQAKYDCLTREVRNLKKRLSQISKLESLEAEEDPENPAISTLSAEQKEKVARRPQLESELCIFEPALERVERRMLQFNLRLKRHGSVGEEAEAQQRDKEPPENTKQAAPTEKTEVLNEAAESTSQSAPTTTPVSLRCSVCKITCPDEKSYALHINGRKHRNRVAQEAEEEKKKAAASMMEERHRQQMEQMMKPTQTHSAQPRTPSAWSQPKIDPKSTVKPRYNLPQPTNTTQEVVEKKTDKPKSFQDIMAEEARRTHNHQSPGGPRGKQASIGPRGLQLPPGSAPTMKSPPWAGKSLIKPVDTKVSPMSPPLQKTAALSKMSDPSSPWLPVSPAKATTSLQLSPGAAPPLKSPPWAAKTTKKATAAAFITTTTSPAQGSKVSSFGDFLRKAPSTPQTTSARSSAAPWSASATPKQVPGSCLSAGPKPSPAASSVSFQDIQKQEEDFRDNVQDQSYQDNSSWFIERRERAGSFTAIQEAATRQREEELMIEEQKRIEEQIQKEVALQKKKEEKKRRQQAKKKAKQNKAKGANGGNTQQLNGTDADEGGGNNNNNKTQTPKKQHKQQHHPKAKTKKDQSQQDSQHPQEETSGKANPESGGGQNKSKGNNRRNSNKNRRKSGKPTVAGATSSPAAAETANLS